MLKNSFLKSENLVAISAKVDHRISSKERNKYKRIRKTLEFIKFMLVNGPDDFIFITNKKFKS